MQITLTLNGIKVTEDVAADMLLIDFVRAHGCKSVKRGCETSNCGLCTPERFVFQTDNTRQHIWQFSKSKVATDCGAKSRPREPKTKRCRYSAPRC